MYWLSNIYILKTKTSVSITECRNSRQSNTMIEQIEIFVNAVVKIIFINQRWFWNKLK